MSMQYQHGTHVLEASAGTGKTYRLSRYVLSLVLSTPDLRTEQVLVVTFTNAATGELQARILALLQTALRVVDAHLADVDADPQDAAAIGFDELCTLAGAGEVQPQAWRSRLAAAIRSFDQLTVSTIHGLCHRILGQYSLLIGAGVGAELRQDTQRELRQAVNDTLVDYERRRTPAWRRWDLDTVLADVVIDGKFPKNWYTSLDLELPPVLLEGSIDTRIQTLEDTARAFVDEVRRNGEAFGAATAALRPPRPSTGVKAVFGASNSANQFYGVSNGTTTADAALLRLLAEQVEPGCRVSVATWWRPRSTKTKPADAVNLRNLAMESRTLSQADKDVVSAIGGSFGVVPAMLSNDEINQSMTTPAMQPLREFLLGSPIVQLLSKLGDLHSGTHLALRAQFVRDARARFFSRLGALDVLTHDDTIRMVADAVRGPHGPALLNALGARYRYGFLDEFQDTDGAQWALFHDLFHARHEPDAQRGLYLVGDPKQAIYAFRGADVQTYQDAVRALPGFERLDTNFRSAVEHVEAVNVLFHHQVALGEVPASAAQLVEAAQPEAQPTTGFTTAAADTAEGTTAWLPVLTSPLTHQALGLEHHPVRAHKRAVGRATAVRPGIEIRLIPGPLLRGDSEADTDGEDSPGTADGVPWEKVPKGTSFDAENLAAIARDIAGLLAAGATLPKLVARDAADPSDGLPTRIRPKDIAVLARTNRELRAIWQNLLELGVPATLRADVKVVDSQAWEWLDAALALLEAPTDSRARMRLAATPLTGWRASTLLQLQEPTSAQTAAFAEWALAWSQHVSSAGVIAGFRTLLDGHVRRGLRLPTDDTRAPAERILSRPAGERELADWTQLVELVDRMYRIERKSWTSIRRALRQTRQSTDGKKYQKPAAALQPAIASDPRMNARLERETPGVQLLTIHKAKGLQFPIVYVVGLNKAPQQATTITRQARAGHEHQGRPLWPMLWTSATQPADDDDAAWAGLTKTEWDDGKALAAATGGDEAMRLAYVALTRAEVKTIWYVALGGDGPAIPERRILGVNLLDSLAAMPPYEAVGSNTELAGFPEGCWVTGDGSSTNALKTVGHAQAVVRTLRARGVALLQERARNEMPTLTHPPLLVQVVAPQSIEEGTLPERVATAIRALEPVSLEALTVRLFPRPAFSDQWRAWSFSGIKAKAGKRKAPALGTEAPEDEATAAASVRDTHEQEGFYEDRGAGIASPSGGASDEPEDRPTRVESLQGVSSDDDDEDTQDDGRDALLGGHPSATVGADPHTGEDALPLSNFPGGTRAGTALHKVFEVYDFVRADHEPETFPDPAPAAGAGGESRERSLAQVVVDALSESGYRRTTQHCDAYQGLLPALRTPLGGPVGGLRLADLPRSRRLDELRFNLLLAGGHPDQAQAFLSGEDFQQVYLSRPSDAAFPDAYKEAVREKSLGKMGLAGFLNGAIDLVFAAEQGSDLRFYVADYKSNLPLRKEGIPSSAQRGKLVASQYAPDCLLEQMQHSDYLLQSTLYLVALHRYLAQRLADYDYDRHIGGAYYLFLRGMAAAAPAGTAVQGLSPGVFFDRPPRDWIEALDAALRTGRANNQEVRS